MEIISWNVNSVRARLPRVAALLARRQPDLVCLQEIKVSPQDFPVVEFAALGYASAVHGQEARNGVAMLARAAPADVARGFDADPAPSQARVLSATAAGLRVMSVYVVNGQAVGTPEYALKLRWLSAFASWLGATQRPGDPLLLIGDFNMRPPGSDRCQSDDQRRVVARLALARGRLPLVPVDHCGGAPLGDRRGAQSQVDPQAPAAVEGALPVVPEREGPGAGVAGAGQVRQTPAQHVLGPDGRPAEPGLR